ncbi:hypothetical protein NMG60_11015302 [Bertholletia excelsa]
MFTWNIAKSAEAMFSRWAVKRVCKFLLKKKLGEFILGDIDLNHLDVQLSAGTIQLSDLALNIDYLNKKFGTKAAVILKEGSIGSLLVTMPWKGKGCEIEVEELELVLAPHGGANCQVGSETCMAREDIDCSINNDSVKLEHEKGDNFMTSASVDVHEGVKTIAKMVKWLLTSFHVKVKKLIVAFDYSLADNGKNTGFCRTLVLRIADAECGTCISEEILSNADPAVSNFLGLNQLTNFVKFEGAVLEFLQMDIMDNDIVLPCGSGATFGEWFSARCPSNARTPIITGENGGFSGTLKLSIPWKDGSLDIRKVDADAYIDPLELRFQPSSIRWFLHVWEIVNGSGKNSKDHADHKNVESVYLSTVSHSDSLASGSCVTSNDKIVSCSGSPSDFCSSMGKGITSDALLPESQLISNWVPFSVSKSQKNGMEEEPDFGASVEQFFECFDGMRSSQSAVGNSGMWNWTCSVFSAITAASNLASGSSYISSEQQHVETSLKVNIAGISVLISLIDGDQQHCDLKGDQKNVGSCVHYLDAKFQEMVLVFQACPQGMSFKATVESVELTDHFTNGDDAVEFGLDCCNDMESQTLKVQQMQALVLGALPPLCPSVELSGSEKPNGSVAADFPFTTSINESIYSRSMYRNDIVKATLLRTSGVTECQFSSSLDCNFAGPTSLTLKMPQFVCWVNFHLINKIIDLLNDIGNSSRMHNKVSGSASESLSSNYCSSSHAEAKSSSQPCLSTSCPGERLKGNIFLPTARVILCFPFKNDGDLRYYFFWDQFIALDFSSPLTGTEKNVQVTAPLQHGSSQKTKISSSIHLHLGNLDIYLMTAALDMNVGSNCNVIHGQKFDVGNVLSVRNSKCHFSVISMLWQKGSVTGPWITERAKLFATSEDILTQNKYVRKGDEFAAVSTAKRTEDLSNHARQEMVLSSSFFVHICLSPMKINLSSSQYKGLHRLLQQPIVGLSCVAHDSVNLKNDCTVSQMSVLVECDSAEISVSQEISESMKSSTQNELPGLWHSLKLQIKKFQLLSVSNIGGISGANFLWIAHGEGNLWGSTAGVPNKEFLLISCNDSTMGRGDGGGSNTLSSKLSGSDIIHMWDPDTSHSCLSITVRCGTLVAIGGRLDWLDAICSFFTLPSPEIEQACDNSSREKSPTEGVPCESTFVLNLVDVGLSYEPYLRGLTESEVFDSVSCSENARERIYDQHVACLLAASSLKLSNSKVADSIESEYVIEIQDLGLLICAVSGPWSVGCPYSVKHLRKVGYVKVAQESDVKATLRINCKNGLLWELECSESHIFVDTCHDTSSGLIHLAAQLQQLFAPDVEESIIHLQTRWNNVQKKAQEREGSGFIANDSLPSTSQANISHLDTKSKQPVLANWMDEICENAFHLDGQLDGLSNISESELHISVDDVFLEETCDIISKSAGNSPANLSLAGPLPLNALESSQSSLLQGSFPEFREGYFLTDLCPVSDLSNKNQSSNEVHKYKPRNMAKGDVGKANNGWYEAVEKVKLLEDHVSDFRTQSSPQLLAEETSTSCSNDKDVRGKPKGCILLKNMNVTWRMYAGSDWHDQKNALHSSGGHGRDRTVCLELALSAMDFQHEIYPEGEMYVSRLSLTVQDFHLNDNSQDAPWKLVLGYYQSKDHPRESNSKGLKLDLEAVRPDRSTPLEEYRLRIAFHPMLLHLHQNHLDFLISFFGEKNSSVAQFPNAHQNIGESELLSQKRNNLGDHSISEEALLPYFQKLDMWPVLIRVDYNPRRFDLAALSGGKYVELVNLVPWKGVELQLKHVHAVGVYGWNSVCETIIGEWLEDISQNQISKLLHGLRPIQSLVAVGSGAAKLVSLPVKNYRKEQRLLKGVQRGTIAFLRSITLEAVGLGVHLAAGAHEILLQAEYILSSTPTPLENKTKANVRSNQPANAKEGIQQACESIGDGLCKTASALVRTPLKRYQRAGIGSALATVLQTAPAAAIAPASAAARAMQCALLGVRNSLDPERKKESIQKYSGITQTRGHITG